MCNLQYDIFKCGCKSDAYLQSQCPIMARRGPIVARKGPRCEFRISDSDLIKEKRIPVGKELEYCCSDYCCRKGLLKRLQEKRPDMSIVDADRYMISEAPAADDQSNEAAARREHSSCQAGLDGDGRKEEIEPLKDVEFDQAMRDAYVNTTPTPETREFCSLQFAQIELEQTRKKFKPLADEEQKRGRRG